jgi:hypothetical protein
MRTLTAGDLTQFTGSDTWYEHPTGLLYTEGVNYVAEHGGAYWLIDAIASYQPQLRRNPELNEFQLWELEVEDSGAVLTCRPDSDQPVVVRQKIEYTDFPLAKIKLYVEGGTLLLPNEH